MLQFVSASLYSLGHGGNDAQKTMGIIAVLLYSQGHLGGEFHVPFWVMISCQAAMGLGTLFGGWRIVHTMGSQHHPAHADAGLLRRDRRRHHAVRRDPPRHPGLDHAHHHRLHHGVGAARRVSAVRWNVANRIVVAWIVTIPATAFIAAVVYALAGLLG